MGVRPVGLTSLFLWSVQGRALAGRGGHVLGSSVLPPSLVSTRTRFAFPVPMAPSGRSHTRFRMVRFLVVWRWEMNSDVRRVRR